MRVICNQGVRNTDILGICGEGKGKRSIAVSNYSHTATGTHMPYWITQCYLPPGRDDILALAPDEAGTRFSDLVGWLHTEMV